MARFVRKHDEPLGRLILAGHPNYTLTKAYEEVKALVWSWNGPRRHLSSSQKAMAYAMMWPEGRQGQRSDLLKNINKSEIDKATISRARFILNHDKNKADLVRDGHPDYPLSKTYEAVKAEAEQRKQQAEIERKKLEQLTELRGNYPDLASLVDEGRIYLDEALETAASRDRKGWKALGYESFKEYGEKELGYQENYIHKLVNAAEISLQIGYDPEFAIANSIPKESRLRPLKSVPEEVRREIWEEATRKAQEENAQRKPDHC